MNASVAAHAGRMDLVQTWSVAILIADTNLKPPLEPGSVTPWPEHPFGRKLIHSLYVMYICVCVRGSNENGLIMAKIPFESWPTPFICQN